MLPDKMKNTFKHSQIFKTPISLTVLLKQFNWIGNMLTLCKVKPISRCFHHVVIIQSIQVDNYSLMEQQSAAGIN